MDGIVCLGESHGENSALYSGDCVDVLRQLPAASVGLSVYSPPFGDLFVYSDSVADVGNSSSTQEFFEHYGFVVEQLLRVLRPGRLVAVHCSDLPTRKWKDGVIGVMPFSDDLVRAHMDMGFVYCGRVTVWKDPVVEMQRTKSLGLLHKQLKKDSTMSRPGMPDYILVFRAPGENVEPVEHTAEEFPVEQWQQWASPVWMDIRQTNVLSAFRDARAPADERHVCPLQLDLIERCITLWSNPGDVVLSPFAGIGSEGYVALRAGRRFIGVELKREYFDQAAANLRSVEAQPKLL